MTDETPAPETSPKRVITGDVDASADPAAASNVKPPPATEQPDPFYVREEVHHRIIGTGRQTLVEYVLEDGEFPEGWPRFQGVGILDATVAGQPQRRDFRFTVPGKTLQEAWYFYDDYAKRGAAQAEQQFRDEIRALMEAHQRQQQPGIVRAGPQALQGLKPPGQ